MKINKIPTREDLWKETVIDAVRWLEFNNIKFYMIEHGDCIYADSIAITVNGFDFELTKEDIMYRADCYSDLVKKGLVKAKSDKL